MADSIDRLDALEMHNALLQIQLVTASLEKLQGEYNQLVKTITDKYELNQLTDRIDLPSGKIVRGQNADR